MDYINELCPVCKKEFTQGDDIVVCPDCGTPHHRECWLADGKCANNELHSEDYSWQPAVKAPVEEQPIQRTTEPSSTIGAGTVPVLTREPDGDAIENLCMRGVNATKDSTFDGVRVGDAALYIQQSAKNYINKFLKGKKLSFNWAALVFAPAWFFYRKMYKAGAIFLTLFVALSLFTMPIAQKGDAMANEIISLVEEEQKAPAENQGALFKDEAFWAKYKSFVKYEFIVIFTTSIVPNLTAALIGNSLYKKKMKRDLLIINDEDFDQDKRFKKALIIQKGGVSLFAGGMVLLLQSSIAPMLLEAGNYIINMFN